MPEPTKEQPPLVREGERCRYCRRSDCAAAGTQDVEDCRRWQREMEPDP